MPITRKKRLERRQSMLSAARELMSTAPYDEITMRNIAAAAGVSPPTLYNTFTTRHGLILEAILGEIEERCIEPVLDSAERGLDRIFRFVSLMAELMESRKSYPQALTDMLNGDIPEGIQQIGLRVHEGTLRVFTAAIEEMRADGEMVDWVETIPLAERTFTLLKGVRNDQVASVLPPEQVDDATTFALAVMLSGVTRGRARERCQAIATEAQRTLGALAAARSG